MGILDAILGGVLNPRGSIGDPGANTSIGSLGTSNTQVPSPWILMALQLLQQSGGIQGLLARLQGAGYGQHAQSWIGTGANMPIDAGALEQIFGSGTLGQIAQQLGISREEAAQGAADALPQVVDRMTPTGEIPDDNNDLVNQALAILQSRRGS